MKPVGQNQRQRYDSSSSADNGTGAKLLSTVEDLLSLRKKYRDFNNFHSLNDFFVFRFSELLISATSNVFLY